ncbi:poly-beta-1,6 N-acetyl-D-glucosamine export porin PgaA [Acinetobacter defluvii]|uniref:poly-beta-1,6 N-acetyl-D-glucosamine export porin PgaA n=1 Tax=Acinetobacter defluvii TaxID=1871111 RepID=UPI001C097B5A|nr:poly-beta-1,6 N-acetyl-D-glucosamine export porin PgaA [Acinetobacter defluvii]
MRNPYYLLFVSVFLYSNTNFSYATQVSDTLRERAVSQIKNGQVQQGAITLEQLVKRYPNNQRILADYLLLVVPIHHPNATKLLSLTQRIQAKQFPEYAHFAVVKLLRDQKQFSQAIYLLEQFEPYQKQNQLQVNLLKALLFSENQQEKQALEVLKKIDLKALTADQLMQVAYSYRILQHPAEAVHAIQYAYKKKPFDENIQKEYVNSLLALGSFERAEKIVQNHPQTKWGSTLKQQKQDGRGGTLQAVNIFDTLREQAVSHIKNGQTQQGVVELEQLLQKYPNNQRILADYLLLVVSIRPLDTATLFNLTQRIQPKQFPEYAHFAVVKLLRDQKQFSQAIYLLEQFEPYQKQNQLQVNLLKALLFSENKQEKQALEVLKKIDLQALTADQLMQVSYSYRIIQHPAEAVHAIQYAYEKKPLDENIQKEYVNSLLALESFQRAEKITQNHPQTKWEPTLNQQIELGYLAQEIGAAIKRHQYLSGRGENDAVSYQKLDRVLVEADQIATRNQLVQPFFNHFYYDYLYALSYRGKSKQVLDILAQVQLPTVTSMPAYVRQAIADAYLAERQAKEAEQLYRTLVTEKNYSDMSVYSAFYYSLLEQEKYDQANQLIHEIDHLLPTFQYSQAKGVDKSVHTDRSQYIGLRGLNWAYSNRLDIAEPYFEGLVNKTSNTDDGLNQLARIQRWRDKPEQAQQTLARLNGLMPVSKTTKINLMQNAQALGDIQAWRAQTDQLVADYPEDTSIVKSRKELADRDRAMIQHSSRFSRSRSDQNNISEGLKGSKDRELTTTLYSPWFSDNYRAFVEHRNIWGKFRQGNLEQQRYGIGLQWQDQRQSLTVTASQNDDADRQGLEAEWTHQFNDHWQYYLNANSQADIPLQAIELGHEGYALGGGIRWKENESRQAGFGYTVTDIDDGNLRQEFSVDYSQRIFLSPHQTTTAGINAYYGKNSLNNVSYFSPKQSSSFGLSLTHEWLTWREYERSFTQRFGLGVGFYQQQNFDTKPIADVQYQHLWKLSRTWLLRYGVGYGIHVYDGEYENQMYGNLGFEGRF